MAELPQVVPGEPIDATEFGNPVIDRVLSRYADSAERDAKVPVPQAGDFAFLSTPGITQVHNGAQWVTFQYLLPTTEFGLAELVFAGAKQERLEVPLAGSYSTPPLIIVAVSSPNNGSDITEPGKVTNVGSERRTTTSFGIFANNVNDGTQSGSVFVAWQAIGV